MPKKKVKKKKSKPNIDIKVSGLDKMIKEGKKKKSCSPGCRGCGHCWLFGSALAMILSYTQNSSILWAILHGAISWFYVLFRAMQIWGWF